MQKNPSQAVTWSFEDSEYVTTTLTNLGTSLITVIQTWLIYHVIQRVTQNTGSTDPVISRQSLVAILCFSGYLSKNKNSREWIYSTDIQEDQISPHKMEWRYPANTVL